MEKIELLFTKENIIKRVKELATAIYNEYGDEEVIFVSTLKGSVFFTCDLLKNYPGNAKIEFIRVSSYDGMNTTRDIKLILPIEKEMVKNKNVILIEDIVDTGYTLRYLEDYFKKMGVKSYQTCVLLDKYCKREANVRTDYIGFQIDDLFVVGYGLDYNQKYRHLPYIGIIK